MEPLDGNAVAGLLHEVFGAEMTTARGACGHCGTVGVAAEWKVWVGGPGTVARCRTCEGLLFVSVEVRGVRCVDLFGLERLDAA